MFVHLTAHSAYSLGEGLALPEDLVQAAAGQGMTCLGLTDHRLLTGAVEFVTACRKAGIKPLLGLEIDLQAGPLSLFAMDLQGWSSLCALSSALALRPNPEAICTLDLLAEHSAGLLALSGAQGVPGDGTLGQLADMFAGRLYLSLQNPATSLPMASLGRRFSLPMVVTHPIYYLHPDQRPLQTTLAAIRLNCPRHTLPPGAEAPPGAHFPSTREMENRFQGSRAALDATQEVAERCALPLPLGVPHMPSVPLPEGISAAQFLRQKAEEGGRQLYGGISQAVHERLDHELQVISRMGFEPVFLIVEELLRFARREGIPFSSRGSAASSLVAHCLGITSPDPLRLNLYFERFLNPARTTPPDIDTDLCSRRRDDVIGHAFKIFGADRVAQRLPVRPADRPGVLLPAPPGTGPVHHPGSGLYSSEHHQNPDHGFRLPECG